MTREMLASARREDIPGKASTPRSSFQVLDRTFSILELFEEDRPEWTTTEVARVLGLPIPTAHRILVALRERGYVSQHAETKRFRLGIALVRLGDRARAAIDLRSVAMPTLRQLSRDTGETALLTVLSPANDGGVCLERVETEQPLRLSVQPGHRLPLHAGASQKALLAFLPDEAIERVLAQPLESLCRNTITSPNSLRQELARIRELGWATSFEETNLGVWGIALPVLSELGAVVCAVGIAGPSVRLAEVRIAVHVARVHQAAKEIADALGHRAPEVARLRRPQKPTGRNR
jgi:DNA-binding IclR family transcriptional regulator